jgi:hypothetical protein
MFEDARKHQVGSDLTGAITVYWRIFGTRRREQERSAATQDVADLSISRFRCRQDARLLQDSLDTSSHVFIFYHACIIVEHRCGQTSKSNEQSELHSGQRNFLWITYRSSRREFLARQCILE